MSQTYEKPPFYTSMPLQVAMMFQKLVAEDGIFEVAEISEKQETKCRPVGLNTVNLLKVGNQMGKIVIESLTSNSKQQQLNCLLETKFHHYIY